MCFTVIVEDLTVIKAALIDNSINQSLLCICKGSLLIANHVAEKAGLQNVSAPLVSNVLA